MVGGKGLGCRIKERHNKRYLVIYYMATLVWNASGEMEMDMSMRKED
jgi:hypothetical protein